MFNVGCPVGGVQRLVISVDGDGQAGAVAGRSVAAVAAAGGEAQRHGADNADGKNCFEDLFHNSKLLFDCFL